MPARAAFDVCVDAAPVPEAPEEVPMAVAEVRELPPEVREDDADAVPEGVADAVAEEPVPEGAVMGSVVGEEMDESGGTENGGVVVSWDAVGRESNAEVR